MSLTIQTAASGVARVAHYVVPTGQTQPIPTLLLEGQRTNLCIRSEEFDTWTDSGTCAVAANAIVAPDGTTTGDTLTSTTAGTSRRHRTVTFTGDGEKCVAIYLKAGTSEATSLSLRDDTAATNRITVGVGWAGGIPTLSLVSGGGTLYPVEALANGWYRVLFSATGVVAANTNSVSVFPTRGGFTEGTVYAWGAQAENAIVPSSYIKTEGTVITRNADSLYFDVPALNPPRAMTVYVRGVEQSNAASTSKPETGILSISAASLTDPSFGISRPSATATYAVFHDPATLTTRTLSAASVVVRDLIEIRGLLFASGATGAGLSINGAAETTIGAGTAQALGPAWSATRVNLNSYGTASAFGQFAFTHVVVAEGEQTMETMRQLAGVV